MKVMAHAICSESPLVGLSNSDRKKKLCQLHLLSTVSSTRINVHEEQELITFLTEDGLSAVSSHNDPLVVTLRVGGHHLRRILIDNGSTPNILFHQA